MSDVQERFVATSAALLDAMANASRLAILTILIKHEVSVGPLSKQIGLSQSALSQHLAKLRNAGLVSRRQEAQTVYYNCNSPDVRKILDLLAEIA
jgi:DNA-binding transcriptional ArsR family regulator